MCPEESQTASIDVSSLKVSVLVCCYNMERGVREAVQSALNQSHSPWEVIVAVDHNQELLERLKAELPQSVKVVPNTGAVGVSDTRNAAVQSATGEIIVFIDDDATAARDCIEKLVQQYRVRSVVAVGGKSVPIWANGRPYWFPEENDWIVGSTHKGIPEAVGEIRNLIGCSMSFRREVFDTVGLFKTELGRIGALIGAGEETEICIRIKQRMPGTLILYEPEAIVYHKVPPQRATFKYMVSRCFQGGLAVARIGKMYAASDEASVSMSTERAYLRYLLTTALLGRLRRLYKPQVIAQIVAILASIAATGMGYISGRISGSPQAGDSKGPTVTE